MNCHSSAAMWLAAHSRSTTSAKSSALPGIARSYLPCNRAHAVLWQNGSALALGSLGGAFTNMAYEINNQFALSPNTFGEPY